MAARRKSQLKQRRTGKPRRKTKPVASHWLGDLGVMRVALLVLAASVMILSPKPGTPVVLEGTGVLSTLIAPSLAPIVFMVLMLDALMGRVLMTDTSGAKRMHYRRIVATNLAAGILLFLWWTPYFAHLLRP